MTLHFQGSITWSCWVFGLFLSKEFGQTQIGLSFGPLGLLITVEGN